jgi:SOS response regulatory protein OraA/RecX
MPKPQRKPNNAYVKALNLLNYKNYSSFEMKRKLDQFSYDESEIREAIEKCIELKLLNDQETFKYYIEQAQLEKKWGYRKIVSKLHEKQVPSDMIRFYMKEYYQKELEEEIKESLIQEKEKTLEGTMEEIKKKGILARFLNQRGF